MPDFTPYTRIDMDYTLRFIAEAVYTKIGALDITAWRTPEPVPYTQRENGEKLRLNIGDSWGGLFDCAWFHFTGQVPEAAKGLPVVLLLDVNGEMCVYDDKGQPVRGLTNATSEYDYSLGRPGKRVLPFAEPALGLESVDVWADAGCNDLFGRLQENGTVKEASIAVCNPVVRALYYDYEVLLDFLKALPEDSARYQQIRYALRDATWALASGFTLEAAQAAREILRPMLAQRGGDPSIHISAIGHAHMDLAWLWPLRETKRKIIRTVSTVLANMQLYPNYHFGASQAQLFQWIKDEAPELYERVRAAVKSGRFEAQGAMWVEADTNVSGGEALVRQVLLGKRFFKEEFDVDVRYLWLPDVFGYTAALPQILKKAGVDYFMTQKISWNLVNRFPHQSFHWVGHDGSEVLTHMLPEETYNSSASPRALHKVEKNYLDKGVSNHALLLFGIGDGGGGPGEEHLERIERLGNMAGLQPLVQQPAVKFFDTWSKQAERFPTWVGELYLERHTGTLTTEARNKWYNRKMEQSLRELEWSALLAGGSYPADRLKTIWQEVLLYQFHDILPGSSIKRVYDESVARYASLHAEVENSIQNLEQSVATGINTSAMTRPAVLFNSLSWQRDAWMKAHNTWKQVHVPSLGYTAIDYAQPDTYPTVQATADLLENDLLRVQFGSDGAIISVFDKQNNREVLPSGTLANQLSVYRDDGDAWDIPLDYARQTPRSMQLTASAAAVDGPHASLTQTYTLGHSELVQEIILNAGSRCIEFNSRLHWRETTTMLRASFPVAVHADEATFEIQFGHIRRPTHRNTSWDLAKDEVAHQKWVDLSQRNYGAAVLNDSKYGCKVKQGVIDLTLLRSVPYPGPKLVEDDHVQPGEAHHHYTDQCEHVFRYAFYPHSGDAVAGEVVRAAYEFNYPLRSIETTPQPGSRAASFSMLQIDSPDIIVEAVKKAEDSDAVIVRLYEASHSSVETTIHIGVQATKVEETNLMEESIHEIPLNNGSIQLSFQPFEIKTIKIS